MDVFPNIHKQLRLLQNGHTHQKKIYSYILEHFKPLPMLSLELDLIGLSICHCS